MHTLSKLPSLHTRANYLCIRFFFSLRVFSLSPAFVSVAHAIFNLQLFLFCARLTAAVAADAATLIDIIKLDCWVLRCFAIASFEWLLFTFFSLYFNMYRHHFACVLFCLFNWSAMEMRTAWFFLSSRFQKDYEENFYCEIKIYVHLHIHEHTQLDPLDRIPTNYSRNVFWNIIVKFTIDATTIVIG